MNLKPEELVRAAMRANPEEGIKELRKSSESTTTCCCEVQTTNEWYKLLMREAADQIKRDQKEIAELREKLPKWISVEERLPTDRLKKYLVAFRDAGGSIVDMARYFPSDGWTCDNWDVPQNLITHWMPLPEPPKED